MVIDPSFAPKHVTLVLATFADNMAGSVILSDALRVIIHAGLCSIPYLHIIESRIQRCEIA